MGNAPCSNNSVMTQTLPTPEELGFDPSELRDKYRIERDKRLRADANDQYIEMAGDFANYIDDPYVNSENNREPLNDETEIIIIGGGFGGLIAGARLRDAGFYDVRIIEKGVRIQWKIHTTHWKRHTNH